MTSSAALESMQRELNHNKQVLGRIDGVAGGFVEVVKPRGNG